MQCRLLEGLLHNITTKVAWEPYSSAEKKTTLSKSQKISAFVYR